MKIMITIIRVRIRIITIIIMKIKSVMSRHINNNKILLAHIYFLLMMQTFCFKDMCLSNIILSPQVTFKFGFDWYELLMVQCLTLPFVYLYKCLPCPKWQSLGKYGLPIPPAWVHLMRPPMGRSVSGRHGDAAAERSKWCICISHRIGQQAWS